MGVAMRMLLAVLAMTVATCALTAVTGAPARADPADCPPNCDRIPDSAWIEPTSIPLYPVYRWPRLAGLAVTEPAARFRFEEECTTPPLPDDPRSYAVAARAFVPQPEGQWQLQVQVLHWRGETWRGAETVAAVLQTAAATLRACQITAPSTSPSITTDEPDRLAAVISVGGRRVLHQYVLADPRNSTVVEIAIWATSPPLTGWPPVPDQQVFDAMVSPLCRAYIDSCR
jgi:hypothetical protein